MYFNKPKIENSHIYEIVKLYYDNTVLQITYLGGIPNSSFRVVSATFDIVIKVYSKGQSTIEHISEEINFIEFAYKNGLATLELCKGINGHTIQYWNSYPVIATKYISGVIMSTVRFTKDLIYQVGKTIARFSQISSMYNKAIKSEGMLGRLNYVFQNISVYLDVDKYSRELEVLNSTIQSIQPEIEIIESIYPKQFIHMDIWPYNLIINNRKIYIVDYDDWIFGPNIIELAVASLEFSMFETDEINYCHCYELLKGYIENSNIKISIAHLVVTMKYLCNRLQGHQEL